MFFFFIIFLGVRKIFIFYIFPYCKLKNWILSLIYVWLKRIPTCFQYVLSFQFLLHNYQFSALLTYFEFIFLAWLIMGDEEIAQVLSVLSCEQLLPNFVKLISQVESRNVLDKFNNNQNMLSQKMFITSILLGFSCVQCMPFLYQLLISAISWTSFKKQ